MIFLSCEGQEKRTPKKSRYEFIALCAKLKIRPDEVGLLPYALVEWTQRLMMAFADYRRTFGYPNGSAVTSSTWTETDRSVA